MKKILLGLVAALIASVIAGLVFINPLLQRAKPMLIASVQSSLGTHLDISNIEISIFPSPGFSLKGIKAGEGRLENQIEDAKLFVSLPSLLHGQVEIASFSISGGKLKAVKTKDGKFLFLKENKDSPPVPNPQHDRAKLDTDSAPKSAKLPIKISDAKIDKISVEIFDELNQNSISIDDLRATASEDGLDTFIESKILAGKDEVNVAAKLIESDLERISADVNFSLSDVTKWITAFVKEPLPAKIEGGFNGKLKFKKEAGINTISNIDLDLLPLGIVFKEFFDKKIGSKFNISLDSLDLATDIVVGNLDVKLDGLDIKGRSITFNPILKAINQKGLTANLNLDSLKSSVPILNSYPITGSVKLNSLDDESLGVDFEGQYDSAKFGLKGQLNNFNGDIATLKDRPFKFDFKLQDSQVNDLLKLAGKEKDFSYSGTLGETNCELLRAMDPQVINVKCTGSNSSINETKLVLSSVIVNLLQRTTGNELEANPVALNVGAQGNINVSYKQGLGGAKDINVKLQTAQLKDLLSLAPSASMQKLPLSGQLSKANVKLAGQAELAGPFDASFTNFTIEGFNLFTKVTSALDKIPGMKEALTASMPEPYRAVLLGDNSSFSTASLKGVLSGANVDIQTLVAQSKGYHIEGKGGMRAGNLDFDLDLVIEKDLVILLEARNKQISQVKGLDGTILIPVTISKSKDGTALVYPNVEKLIKSLGNAQVREVGKKALDKVMPGLGGVVDGFLGN